jgi:hypothetical protein
MRVAGLHFLTTAVLFLASSVSAAAEMTAELKFEGRQARALRTRFATYGYRPDQACSLEEGGLRLWLPEAVAGTAQTGYYSHFALAGDCEVSCTYELLHLQPAKNGYGSGVGLAFDVEDGVSRGVLQRMVKPSEGNVYLFQTILAEKKGKTEDQEQVVATRATSGRIGLRRVNQELIFLVSDDPAGPLQEVERLPFTDQTIRAVRFFADPGGAPTAVDVRVREIVVRAEVITDGVPHLEKMGPTWWPWVVFPLAGLVSLGLWRVYRNRAGRVLQFTSRPKK